MSADLLAAFGSSEYSEPNIRVSSSTKPSSSVDTNLPVRSKEQPWILQSRPIPNKLAKNQNEPLWKQDSQGANVLFDASGDEQDEDDFGDFVEASVKTRAASAAGHTLASTHQQAQGASIDLLGLDGSSKVHLIQPQQRLTINSRSQDVIDEMFEWGPKTSEQHIPREAQHDNRLALSVSPPLTIGAQEVKQESFSTEDEGWGSFESVEPQSQHGKSSSSNREHSAPQPDLPDQRLEDEEWDNFEDGPSISALVPTSHNTSTALPPPTTSTSLSNPRPTNIPPPSTLLQLLPNIYTQLSQESRSANHDFTSTVAQRIVQIYKTTARLISGRQHRWKRDTLLSQSTRISQAGLKTTGMKLTALDRSEAIKEDQDTQEAISAWTRHAATLNAAILRGKVQKPAMSLGPNMAVRMASGPGVLTAKECCAVCGLRRNERVLGIDVKVEDTFGDFWVEFWGHRDCYDFWYAYEALLNKR